MAYRRRVGRRARGRSRAAARRADRRVIRPCSPTAAASLSNSSAATATAPARRSDRRSAAASLPTRRKPRASAAKAATETAAAASIHTDTIRKIDARAENGRGVVRCSPLRAWLSKGDARAADGRNGWGGG